MLHMKRGVLCVANGGSRITHRSGCVRFASGRHRMNVTAFKELARVFERLEQTSSSTTMIEILAHFLPQLSPQEARMTAYLLSGKVGPSFSAPEFGMAEKMIVRAVAQAFDVPPTRVMSLAVKLGDLGAVAERLNNRRGAGLTIGDVFALLTQIPTTSGTGSQQGKIDRLARLLQCTGALEAKYVVRTVSGMHRIGVAEMTFLQGLARAVGGTKRDKPVLEHAYNVLSDLGKVAFRALSGGLASLKRVGPKPGIPVRMMLATRVEDLDEVPLHLTGPLLVEYKYDGERVQIHKDASGEMRVFSRRLEEITHQYPEVLTHVRKNLAARSAIVEGEVVAIDPKTQRLLPFQVVMQRKRKLNIEQYQERVPVAFFAFDLLYLNGTSLLVRPLSERKGLLAAHLKSDAKAQIGDFIQTDVISDAEAYFHRAVARGAEGVVIKGAASPYQAGHRGWYWIKFKKEYEKELADTFDLAIVGALHGKGSRAGSYGSVLAAGVRPTDEQILFADKGRRGYHRRAASQSPENPEAARYPAQTPLGRNEHEDGCLVRAGRRHRNFRGRPHGQPRAHGCTKQTQERRHRASLSAPVANQVRQNGGASDDRARNMEHVSGAGANGSRARHKIHLTTHRFSNQDVANILFGMSVLYDMKGVQFKPRAYERAAHGVESAPDNLQDVFAKRGADGLKGIPGVGAGIQSHLAELFTTGHFKEYDRFKKQVPVDIMALTAVQGVGPQTIKTLWTRLHIKDVDDLEKAARAGKISVIPHFGKTAEQKIIKNIEFLRKSGQRFILGFVAADVRRLQQMIARMPEVEKVEVAGSFRRRKETIRDVDLLIASEKPQAVMSKLLALPLVGHVYGTGPTKTSMRLKSGINVDVRIVPAESWGAALAYFTGSEPHNIGLRMIAQKRGWKLSEYGLFKGNKMLAGKTEEEVYDRLGLPYIEPELREMTGELDAAKTGKLPKLISYDALKGDLQVQTNWTDGNATIEKMADAAEASGLTYIAITDHTKSLAMARGLDDKGLLRQIKEIAKINKKRKQACKKLTILSGAEVNIQKDGSLDISDKVLGQLEIVGAAIHSHFDLPRREQTQRLIRAIENPNVDIIFHPTCRLINGRPEIQLDIDEIIAAAKRTHTILEIDAYPDRLDLRDEYIKKCVQAGVLLAIDSDAHAPEHFALLQFGVAQARRGWATASDVINTLPLAKVLAKLK